MKKNIYKYSVFCGSLVLASCGDNNGPNSQKNQNNTDKQSPSKTGEKKVEEKKVEEKKVEEKKVEEKKEEEKKEIIPKKKTVADDLFEEYTGLFVKFLNKENLKKEELISIVEGNRILGGSIGQKSIIEKHNEEAVHVERREFSEFIFRLGVLGPVLNDIKMAVDMYIYEIEQRIDKLKKGLFKIDT